MSLLSYVVIREDLLLGSPASSLCLLMYPCVSGTVAYLLLLLVNLDNLIGQLFPLLLIMKITSTLPVPLLFHVNCLFSLSDSRKRPVNIFIGLTLSWEINLERIDVLMILNRSPNKNGMSPFIHVFKCISIKLYKSFPYWSVTFFMRFIP